MKVSVLFDMKSEKVFAIIVSNRLKVSILFKFFWPNGFLLYVLGSHACFFLTSRMPLIKKNFVYI